MVTGSLSGWIDRQPCAQDRTEFGDIFARPLVPKQSGADFRMAAVMKSNSACGLETAMLLTYQYTFCMSFQWVFATLTVCIVIGFAVPAGTLWQENLEGTL